MRAGDALLLYDEDIGPSAHLNIVLTDPDSEGRVVLVSVTTRRAKSDPMVSLEPGVHEFITHASVIAYYYSKILTVQTLQALVASGNATLKARVSDELLRRARAGMRETDRAPREVQNFFLEVSL